MLWGRLSDAAFVLSQGGLQATSHHGAMMMYASQFGFDGALLLSLHGFMARHMFALMNELKDVKNTSKESSRSYAFSICVVVVLVFHV